MFTIAEPCATHPHLWDVPKRRNGEGVSSFSWWRRSSYYVFSTNKYIKIAIVRLVFDIVLFRSVMLRCVCLHVVVKSNRFARRCCRKLSLYDVLLRVPIQKHCVLTIAQPCGTGWNNERTEPILGNNSTYVYTHILNTHLKMCPMGRGILCITLFWHFLGTAATQIGICKKCEYA